MSIKSKVLVFLTIACILLVSFTVAFAKGEPRYIFPFGNREYTVSSKDEIVIRFGWWACSKGLVNDTIDSASNYFYFDGTLIEDIQKNDKSYYDPIENRESPNASMCLWDVGGNIWISYWNYSLGKLDPGDHELEMEVILAFPVIDGADINGDGLLDVYQDVYSTSTTIIHVTP